MDLVALLAIQVLYAIASLALISVGLAIIFGMMKVINLAHGEFLMLGGYAAIEATSLGISIWIAMLVVAPDRRRSDRRDRRAHDHPLALRPHDRHDARDLGPEPVSGRPDDGGVRQHHRRALGAARQFRDRTLSHERYTLFVIAVAIVVLGGVLATLRFTRLGLIARGTMQNANMAAALGVNPNRVYSVTFGVGAALTGLAGGVLAPVSGVFPTIGVAYVAKSFITVIGGGAAIVTGTSTASALFGAINQIATYVTTPVFGEVALLAAAIVLIRVLPQGITGRFFRRSL